MNEINNFKPPAVSEDVTHESVVDSNVDNKIKIMTVLLITMHYQLIRPNTGVSQEKLKL